MEKTGTLTVETIFTRLGSERFPSFRDGEVHVWRVSLKLLVLTADELKPLLSDDELIKAEQLRFPKDRSCYVIRRGLLRLILGRYLNVNPKLLKFSYGPQGKPLLLDESNRELIYFNLSHSAEMVLLAVTRTAPIGIDIEHVRDDLAEESLAQHFCSTAEISRLRALPDQQKKEAFFRCWTRKEAYVKALGAGLFFNLKDIEVSFEDVNRPVLFDVNNDLREIHDWSAWAFRPAPNYKAALVIKYGELQVKYFSASRLTAV